MSAEASSCGPGGGNDPHNFPTQPAGVPRPPAAQQPARTNAEEIRTIWARVLTPNAAAKTTIKETPKSSRRMSHLVVKTQMVAKTGEATALPADYELLDVIGEGGMGVVYAARQTSMDRTIAFKMLKPDSSGDEAKRAQFLCEASVTGDLEHPNIIPVYDLVGSREGHLFYAMKRVKGTRWSDVLPDKTTLDNMDILLHVADAVAFAHSRGVIHRDIKPENVMLGDFGEVLLMDWGLAAAVGREGKAQRIEENAGTGGTPAYMAPEMARSDLAAVSFYSDVYLLGATLYEIVTHNPPHPGKSVVTSLVAAGNNDISATDKQGELLDIALKAMATRPEERYQSAKEFQAAVRRYLGHAGSLRLSSQAASRLSEAETSRQYENYARALAVFQEALALWPGNSDAVRGESAARLAYARCAFEKEDLDLAGSLLVFDDPSHAELARDVEQSRQGRDARRKRIRTLTAASVALTALIIVTLTIAFFWIRSEQTRAEAARQNAESEREEAVASKKAAWEERAKAVREAYHAKIPLVLSSLREGNAGEAEDLLDSCPKFLRGWEWGHLKHLCHLDLTTFRGHSLAVNALQFTPDGGHLISAGEDRAVQVWDVKTGESVCLKDFGSSVLAVGCAPDGRRLICAEQSGTVSVWDLAGRKRLSTFGERGASVSCAACSPDGNLVALGYGDGGIVTWDVRSGQKGRGLTAPKGSVVCLAFSADGKFLLSSSKDYVVRLWNIEKGELAGLLQLPGGNSSGTHAAAFNPEGTRVATGTRDSRIFVWDTAARAKSLEFPTRGAKGSDCIAFSPKGNRIAAGADSAIRVWDAGNGRELFAVAGHGGLVHAVAFSPDGTRIASGGADGVVELWDTASGRETRVLWTGSPQDAMDMAAAASFSPGGEWLAASAHNRVELFDGRTGAPVMSLPLPQGEQSLASAVIFSPQGDLLAASAGTMIHLWETKTWQLRAGIPFAAGLTNLPAFSPDGKFLAYADAANTIRFREVDGGRELAILTGFSKENTHCVAFNRDGTRLASIDGSNVRLWRIEDRQATLLTSLVGGPGHVDRVTFSPGDDVFASRCPTNGVIKFWNAESGAEITTLKGQAGGAGLLFHPDGKRLVSGTGTGAIQIWDAKTGRLLVTLRRHDARIRSLAFSPDGRSLVTGSYDQTLRLWESTPRDKDGAP